MSRNKNPSVQKERKFIEKDDDTEYGLVIKKLGGSRFLVKLNLQEKEIIARVCGKFRKGGAKKNNWVDVGTVVLVGLRDYQDTIVDIIHVYDSNEVRRLRKDGIIVFDNTGIQDENTVQTEQEESDIPFDFEDI
jgi:translation initiation factor 1A